MTNTRLNSSAPLNSPAPLNSSAPLNDHAQPNDRWLTPGTPEFFDEVRGFQTAYSHRPDVVVVARTAEDVRLAVEYAAGHHLPVAVQCTGHGLSVPADGGLLITTGHLQNIVIDPERQTARVDAGVRAGSLVDAAAAHGLAPLNGSSPSVGIVGYTLGGGMGLMFREFGYSADHVLAVDLVTADGRLRTLHPGDELFAAVLGTGGNFGVVTAIELSLVPVRRIFGGQLVFDTSLVPRAVTTWRDWTRALPQSITSSLTLVRYPDLDVLPSHLRGHFVASVRIVCTEPRAAAEELLAPLRAIGPRLIDDLRSMPYTESHTVHADPDQPHAYAATNALLSDLPDEGIDTLLEQLDASPETVVDLRHVKRPAPDTDDSTQAQSAHTPEAASAVCHRDAAYVLRLIGDGVGTSEPAQFPGLLSAIAPWNTGQHLNFSYGAADAADDGQTRTGYTPESYNRLVRLKARYDPDNMFRFNRNIVPAPRRAQTTDASSRPDRFDHGLRPV